MFITNEVRKQDVNPFTVVHFFLGLMHGSWEIKPTPTNYLPVNLGIAIVVPASKILEVIEQPEIKKVEEEILKKRREKNSR